MLVQIIHRHVSQYILLLDFAHMKFESDDLQELRLLSVVGSELIMPTPDVSQPALTNKPWLLPDDGEGQSTGLRSH